MNALEISFLNMTDTLFFNAQRILISIFEDTVSHNPFIKLDGRKFVTRNGYSESWIDRYVPRKGQEQFYSRRCMQKTAQWLKRTPEHAPQKPYSRLRLTTSTTPSSMPSKTFFSFWLLLTAVASWASQVEFEGVYSIVTFPSMLIL